MTDRLEAIRFAYEQYLLDDHWSAQEILCQQVGQILGLAARPKYGPNTRYSVRCGPAEFRVCNSREEAEAYQRSQGRPDVYIVEKPPGYRNMYEENLA